METEVIALPNQEDQPTPQARPDQERNRWERHRLIAHLGRTFSRRYDIQVLPSRQKGLWACGLDPKAIKEISEYVDGKRDTLDDLPPEAFEPKQILYDEEAAAKMSMDEITTLLHHEAGHAKYTDFRLMFEGQRQAKDEGHLATSFWLVFEGMEDPRVNGLEGRDSPAIDRQIRRNQGKDLQERLTELPISQRPRMLQFAYNSFHYWLHDEPIPELAGTEVGKVTEQARPLLEEYFRNSDPEQRKALQKQIWDIAKALEGKDVEDEQLRQMAKQKGMDKKERGSKGQGEGEQLQISSEQGGQQTGTPAIPGAQGDSKQIQEEKLDERKGFLDKLKEELLGDKEGEVSSDQSGEASADESQESERFDLSKLFEEEIQELKDAIEKLSSEEQEELLEEARKIIDEEQMRAMDEEFTRFMNIEKNKETGEYEAKPVTAGEETIKKSEEEFEKAARQTDAEDQVELQRQEAERRTQEELFRQQETARREKLEMEKAGFDEDEREKFLLYQSFEDSMYSYVRNFRQAIEKVIPRKREPLYEGGYFSGPKFERRDLVKKAPVGDEQFWKRQIEAPTGEPRLFISLLIDNSGSMAEMGGKKRDEARKTTIFFAKVCRDMGIPFMAVAFGDGAKVIKEFKQDFDNPAERIKPAIIDSTEARDSSTNMYEGIKTTIEAMNEQRRQLPDSHGLIFVITDSGANAGLTGDALRDYIEENRGRLTFKAFGLSGSERERAGIQSNLNNYFGESNCAYPQGFEDLPDEAFRVLRVNLMQFQRFLA